MTTTVQAYDELRVRAHEIGPGRYLVTANGPASAADIIEPGTAPERLRERFAQLIQVELGRAPSGESHVTARLRALGREVYDLLLTPPLADCVARALDRAREQRPARGLRLRFSLPPALRDLPVETLTAPATAPQQSLALNHSLSLVRTLDGDPPGARLPEPGSEPGHIRLLVAAASPEDPDLPALRPGPELEALTRELPEVAVQTTVLEHATRRSLEDTLAAHGDQPTVLLLIAHGTYDEERGEGLVHLEAEDGTSDRVPGHLLSGMLTRAPQLRLVVLNLCSGADSATSEPFSGLAQALIGRGVPAVVAMRGQVSDVASAAFSPVLLQGVSANRTLDECVTTARRHISDLPGHTAIEWTTPVLFLHESYRHGWLFKAREVRDEKDAQHDPLHAGAEALREYEEATGHVRPELIMSAARFLRESGEWERVLRTTQPEVRRYRSERAWLRDEARTEIAWPGVVRLCDLLAAGADMEAENGPGAALTALRGQLPTALATCLSAEVRQVRKLAGLLERAAVAESRGDWQTALRHYDEVLRERPHGFRDAERRRAAARDEAEVAGMYAAAERTREAGDWPGAARRYADVLAHRSDGYREAAHLAAYTGARTAEAEGDWPAAAEGYARCGATLDAPARLTSVRGRAAAAAGRWDEARDACAEAVELGLPDEGWATYAAARAAEDAGDWTLAAHAYAAQPGSADGARRLPYARARACAAHGDWPAALRHFDAALAEDPGAATDRAAPVAEAHAPWHERARTHVYDLGAEAEECAQWALAAELFGMLPGTVLRKGQAAYADAARRAHYARGRAAQEAGRWDEAAGAYRTTGHADAALRLGYVRGRAYEEAEEWEEARACWLRLPSRLLDAAERHLYAAGRIADRDGDWAGVIEGFGRLPDSHAGGEVGSRRLHARARLAEARADWGSVLSHLSGIPDGERGGAVRLLRAKAGGRRAEESGDWPGALDHYLRAGDSDPEVAALCHYARGRTHETACRWTEALAAYAPLTEDHQDVAFRRAYAHARLAEQAAEEAGTATDEAGTGADAAGTAAEGAGQAGRDAAGPGGFGEYPGHEGWQAAREAYDKLPRDFEDVARRAAYARARLAEAAGDWQAAAAEADPLGAYRDARALAAYARARLAEAGERWTEAAEAYERCPARLDTPGRLAYARGRSREAAGQWSAAIDAYGQALEAHSEAAPRRRRLRRLREALPWADGLGSTLLVADKCALEDPAFPYLALRGVGITPGSSTEEVQNAVYALMEHGAMAWHERVAWDQLRMPAKRLQLDALLYRLRDPAGLREKLTALPSGGVAGGGEPLDLLCAQLPDDTPLLVLLARGRQEAIEVWERRLRATPADMDTVHALAVARLWEARELEESGAWEHAALSWERALAYWAALLTDDAHWTRWRRARAACYQHTIAPEDVTQLRWELGRSLFDMLSGYAERHAEQGRTEHVRTYKSLVALLETELDSARELKDAGGLPLPDGPEAEPGQAPEQGMLPDPVLAPEGAQAPERGQALEAAPARPQAPEPEPGRASERDAGAGRVTERGAGAGRLAAGPAYLRMMGLQAPLAAFAARLDPPPHADEGGQDRSPGQSPGQSPDRNAGHDTGHSRGHGTGHDPGAVSLRALVAGPGTAAGTDQDHAAAEHTARAVRRAFSELATASTLFGHHRFEPALRALPPVRALADLPDDCVPEGRGEAGHAVQCTHCTEFLRDNPAYTHLARRRSRLVQDTVDLAVRARLALARIALTGTEPDPDGALEQWAEAIRVAQAGAMTVRTKHAIARTVLGRADALADGTGDRLGACLDAAVDLVDRALPLLGAPGREQLSGKLSELLSTRGVWRGYGCADFGMRPDIPRAEADLRRALALNPESVRARDNLARALVFGMESRAVPRTPFHKLGTLHEALTLVHEGLERAPTHARFRETLGETLQDLEALLLNGLSFDELAAFFRPSGTEEGAATGPDAGTGPDAHTGPGAEAATGAGGGAGAGRESPTERVGGTTAAVHRLVRATRADPADAALRRDLLATVQQRLDELRPPEE
ncbi:CHAT domain-containing protein [Streptomyces iconiensis]|uniref:CHAT domain-containing protein n=1 Tax=Streptomyces iconiensis TaxID=1384038 RepID=A0ABT7A7Y3_9ACTN|nr:CHAT domain-containing protein [Streptomyces iconiensis]MDJ1137446.1 CHAT domain-containing protein [Streptomyces iconiensis]